MLNKHGNSFEDFFQKFFDPSNEGTVNMAGILNAFHSKIGKKFLIF